MKNSGFNQLKTTRTTLSRLASVSTLLLCAQTVQSATLEEVVVTAQKRSESLQDVPIAVTAFTGDTMKALGVTDATDLVNITPGLSAKTQGGSSRNYYVRGVGTTDTHLTAASAVGQYMDGITLTSGFHAKAALFDMERVEVLKGPQNTLFGLNTTGGAINYISNKPEIGGGTTGHATLKLGSYSLINVDAAVGFELGSKAAGRIAITSNDVDGGFDSVSNDKDYGDDDTQAVRAQFDWDLSNSSNLLINLHGMQSKSNGTAVKSLGSRQSDGGTLCDGFNGQQIQDFEHASSCFSRTLPAVGTGVPASNPINPSEGDWDKLSQDFGSEDLETKGVFVKFEYDFDWMTFASITSFDNLDVRAESNRDGTDRGLFHFWQQDDRDTFQQEFRLISSADGTYRWIAGVYWLDDDAESYTAIRTRQFQNGSFAKLPNVQLDHSKENLGIYAQGEYDLTEVLTLTAGVRWSDEEINANYLPSRPDVSDFPAEESFWSSDVDALAAGNTGMPGFDSNGFEIARQVSQKLENEDVGFTVKLDWQLLDDSLVYASFSRGFKGSAADIRAAFASVPVPNLEAGLESARLDPESLDAWELGYKSSFLDNSLQLDASIFRYIYEDLQQFVTPGGVPTLENAPESEINGFEANVKYVHDLGFYIQGGVAYLDTEVTDSGESSFIEGAPLANSPEWSYMLLASQDFNFSNGSLLTVMANVSYTDEAASQTLTVGTAPVEEALTRDSYTLLNANITYHFGNAQQYAVSVFGNNLSDENYCNTIDSVDAGGLTAAVAPVFNVPGSNPPIQLAENNFWQGTITCRVSNASTRTFGVSFGMEF